MLLKNLPVSWLLLSLVSLAYGQNTKKTYPEADAVYLHLTKTYILNPDGSMVTAVDKRQQLLTHRAFQSMYGETRINYNPQYQKVTVNKAFTENNLNEKIETPSNGYNEILPGFSNNIKAFSHLREMVVTHTGLETGAIINCGWEVQTAAGNIPWLMGDELLQTDCPIGKLIIQVKVPLGKSLYFKLLNANSTPKIEHGKEYDSYTWQFSNLPQRNREILSAFCDDQPRLLFSTMPDRLSTLKWLTNQEAFSLPLSEDLKNELNQKLSAESSPILKALKIQEIVVKELNSTPIPEALLAWKVRSPMQVWQSNSGTSLEKSCLLSACLKAAGFDAQVCLVIPACYAEEKTPYLLASEPVVRITDLSEGVMLLSAERLNAGNYDLCNNHQAIIPLGSDAKIMNNQPRQNKLEVKGVFVLTPEGKLQGEMTGSFSNRYNPYYELLRAGGLTTGVFPGLSGKAGNLTSSQSDLTFTVDKGNAIQTRGNFKFMDLMESLNGISSLHLNPLPFNRTAKLDLGSPLSESYHYAFTVPEGYHLANKVDMELNKTGVGKVTLRINQRDRLIEVTRDLEIFHSVITKEQYANFRELTDRWFTLKYKQLVMLAD